MEDKKMFRVAGIERNSVVDGEGWRYVIFFQGCKHRCLGCHNPETWDFNGGREMTTNDILKDLRETDPEKFMDITLSGGDPFYQADKIIDLCKELKKLDYNIWAYTGFDFEQFLSYRNCNKSQSDITNSMIELLKYIDVVVDRPFIASLRTVELAYRGSSNQRLIDVKKSLKYNKVVEYECI